MTVVCGTDFSDCASDATRVAASIARRIGEPLLLIHAVAPLAVNLLDGADRLFAEILSTAERSLASEAAELRDTGAEVVTRIVIGFPDRTLLEAIANAHATVAVIGSVGHRHGAHWLIGSTAERIVAGSAAPVLVIRDAEPLLRWTTGEAPLRVLVATDFPRTPDRATDWANALTRIGRCTFSVAHVYWPPAEHQRLGIGGPIYREEPHPIVREILGRELDQVAFRLQGSSAVSKILEPHLGRAADAIADLAARHKADLVILGVGPKGDGESTWIGSVSQGVVHAASMNVACIPPGEARAPLDLAAIKTVLAATDFSEGGNQAVRWAWSIAPRGSRVIVVHAIARGKSLEVKRVDPELAKESLEHLRSLVPAGRLDEAQLEVLDGPDEVTVICATATREGAEVICVGAHGGSAVHASLFGSVTSAVLARGERPVLVVPKA